MNQRQIEIKRILFTTLFITTIFLSNVLILNNFNLHLGNKIDNTSNEGVLDEIKLNSNLNLSDPITGSGADQEVRIFVKNESQNLNDNQEFFEIPSLASEDMVLTYGNFSFSFQNNYTTDYVIEDDDALYPEKFISFDFNSSTSDITYHNGSWNSGYLNNLTDGNPNTPINISSINGVINFTITANFTNTKSEIEDRGFVQFNRTKILALISALLFELQYDANLTVRIKDFSQPTWKEVITSRSINSSLGKQGLKEHFINENLNFINLSNVCDIQFIFERWYPTEFNVSLYEYDLQSTYAFDLPITNKSYVALEFDLKGLESAVNGLNIWIRTLNLTEAATTHFNITLYRANTTIDRTETYLRTINLGPDYNDSIDNKVVDSYTGDNYSYFKFNIINTGKLNLSNYFVVIKSNNSKQVYSLVTLPPFGYGDNEVEHQLKTTKDDGKNWKNAEKSIETDGPDDYPSGQLDASLFTLNVTRGYRPSDFNISGTYNLTIQDLPLEDLEISSFPYNESSDLTWGIGQWIHNFTTPISDEGSNNFTVYLLWNKANITGFEFNVSYSVNAYWIENASATYSATYNSDPEWIYNYTKDNTNPNFKNWTFFEFWFVYPDFLNAQNLTKPFDQEILWRLDGQMKLIGDPSKYKLIVPESIANISGDYLLNLTSHNFIHNMHSYINYNGTLWETSGFMYGDNISIAVEIQDHNFNAPIYGDVNATLFYPNSTRFIGSALNTSDGFIDESILFYDFGNRTILNFTNTLTIFGEYHLGFFWFNGTAIGCKEITLYLDAYQAELYNFEYYSNINKNILDGKIEKVYQNYTSLIASVNETTGIFRPNYYPINDFNINTQFVYEIGGFEIPILIDKFKQSQNIINPNETINVRTTIQNLFEIGDSVNVKINVKLVSFANKEWIIVENTTNNYLLEPAGFPGDTYEFDVNLKIPDLNVTTNVWAGKNNPIRLAGAKTLITVFVDNIDIGTYETDHISLLSSEISKNYDGYILGIKINEDMNTENILNEFSRDECLYSPYSTSFIVNIFDRNYVSSYNQDSKEFYLNLNSKFINLSINPKSPIKGQSFNISSILITEFGEQLIGKNVNYQYYNSSSWINLGSDFTDSNGFTTFIINTQQIDFKGNLLIRISWNGDDINGFSKNVSINVIHQSNNISISIKKNSDLIYRNRIATMTITLRNIGDSNLRIFRNISIEFNHALSYSIVSIDYLKLEQFSPEESTNLIINIDIGNINILEISISIKAQNIITNETKTTTVQSSFPLNDPPIYDYFIEYFILIIGVIFAVIWIGAIMYAWKTKKRIETPIEEPTKKKPRRERYVPVSELKKPTPPKKTLKKREEPKEVKEKKETDLDSLLEERGLSDKKKKT
ncbi:MAG: hypothetical protein HWN81_09550 [Candidatus Lokiarchaeota archaeon]|nr:hypothetical protein [Candidatus Lokiarchaeota archaeon]